MENVAGPEERYLLCRPRGGLNDNLVQIEKCWLYAERYRRVMVLDTTVSSGIAMPFFKAFSVRKSQCKIVGYQDSGVSEKLNRMGTFPVEVAGRLDFYRAVYERDDDFSNFRDSDSGRRLTFDFSRDYPDQLLVHDQSGGGIESLECLRRLELSENFREKVRQRLDSVINDGEGYYAVHVRNTDYKTDFEKFFRKIFGRVAGKKLLLCSDNASVIRYAMSYFNQSRVFFMEMPPDTGGMGLHRYARTQPDEERERYLVSAISDLIALSCSSRLFLAETSREKLSGYSRLAAMLHKRREVVMQLMGLHACEKSFWDFRSALSHGELIFVHRESLFRHSLRVLRRSSSKLSPEALSRMIRSRSS